MKIGEIVRMLDREGVPLSAQQIQALEREGGKRMREIRSEVRDMVADRFRPDIKSIERAAEQVIAERVKKTLDEKVIERMVTDALHRAMPTPIQIVNQMKDQINNACHARARQIVSDSLRIEFQEPQVNQTGEYEQGGSF